MFECCASNGLPFSRPIVKRFFVTFDLTCQVFSTHYNCECRAHRKCRASAIVKRSLSSPDRHYLFGNVRCDIEGARIYPMAKSQPTSQNNQQDD